MLSYQQLQKLIYKIPQNQQQIARQWVKRLQQPVYYQNESKINEKYTKILQCQLQRLSQGQGSKLEYPLNFMPLQTMLTDIPDFICRKFQLPSQSKDELNKYADQQATTNITKNISLNQKNISIKNQQDPDNRAYNNITQKMQLNQQLNNDEYHVVQEQKITQKVNNMSFDDQTKAKKMKEIDDDLQGLLSDDNNTTKKSQSVGNNALQINIQLNEITGGNTQEETLSARQNFYQQLHKSQQENEALGEHIQTQKDHNNFVDQVIQLSQNQNTQQRQQQTKKSFNQEQQALNDELASLLYPNKPQNLAQQALLQKEDDSAKIFKEFDALIQENYKHNQKVDELLSGNKNQTSDQAAHAQNHVQAEIPPAYSHNQIPAQLNSTGNNSFSLSVNGLGKNTDDAPVVTKESLHHTQSKYGDMIGSGRSIIEFQECISKQLRRQQQFINFIYNNLDMMQDVTGHQLNTAYLDTQINKSKGVQELAEEILQSIDVNSREQSINLQQNTDNNMHNIDQNQSQLIDCDLTSNKDNLQNQHIPTMDEIKQEIQILGLSNVESTGKSIGRAKSTGTLGFIDSNTNFPKTSGPKSKFFSKIDNSFPVSYEQTPQYDTYPLDVDDNKIDRCGSQPYRSQYETKDKEDTMQRCDFGLEIMEQNNLQRDNEQNIPNEIINSSGGSYVRVNSVYGEPEAHDNNCVENNVTNNMLNTQPRANEANDENIQQNRSPGGLSGAGSAVLEKVKKTLEDYFRNSPHSHLYDKINTTELHSYVDNNGMPDDKQTEDILKKISIHDQMGDLDNEETQLIASKNIYKQMVQQQEQNQQLFNNVQQEVQNAHVAYLEERLRLLELQLKDQDELIRQFFQYAD